MPKTPEELKADEEALAKKETEEKERKEKEEEDKLEALVKDKDAAKGLLEAKRKANAEAKELRLKVEAFEKEKKEAEDKGLEDEKKWEELAGKKEAELKEKEAKFIKQTKIAALKMEAIKQNIKDSDDVRLIDLENVKIDESFKVENAQEVIEDFKESKSHLFKGDDDEEDDETKLADGSTTPNLRDKVKGGASEGESRHTRAAKAFSLPFMKKKK